MMNPALSCFGALAIRACNPVASYNDPSADFRFAKAGACSDVLVGEDENGGISASVMVGHDGHRGWIYYVAADPRSRGVGFGRQMVEAAEAWVRQRGVVKVSTSRARNEHHGHFVLRALGI
jgi:GNAT superfamily N-acetyltransferase